MSAPPVSSASDPATVPATGEAAAVAGARGVGDPGEGRVVRVRFAKRGRVRFISHRDVARAFERALRVAGLPVAVTRGFTPHPRIGFGLALAVGHESDAEYLDVGLDRAVEPSSVVEDLAAVLPDGLTPEAAVDLAPGAPALQEAVTSVEYLMVTGVGAEVAAGGVAALLAAGEVEVARSRKGRRSVEDVRPLVRHLSVVGHGEGWSELHAEVATRPRGLRPSELLEALGAVPGPAAGVEFYEGRGLRTPPWLVRGGAPVVPRVAHPRPRAPAGHAS
ncbi:MAG: TIGR03936 family radical SAM-associated protein [Acidimicrobiia bacterium]|nr:TIGR03936 family radical SAM-associated protein [Acidimicrobiia bacterium]